MELDDSTLFLPCSMQCLNGLPV